MSRNSFSAPQDNLNRDSEIPAEKIRRLLIVSAETACHLEVVEWISSGWRSG